MNKMIARELKLSQKTVENHRMNIMQKLQINSLAILVQYYTTCIIQGMISKEEDSASA
jgi:FixJ family two-component response regulator